jgi:hypothetical protein
LIQAYNHSPEIVIVLAERMVWWHAIAADPGQIAFE